jgi:hypothetical protein
MPRPPLPGPSERESSGSGGGSDGGTGNGDNRVDANENQVANTTSTPGPSLHPRIRSNSGLGSSIGPRTGSSPFRRPPVDTRQQYKGFPFVFATDAYHCTETVYGDENGDCVRYLKPIHQGQRMDHLPPIRLPYFFTGFQWKNVDGQQCSVSLPHRIVREHVGSLQSCPVSNFVMLGKSLSIDCYTMLVSWRRRNRSS